MKIELERLETLTLQLQSGKFSIINPAFLDVMEHLFPKQTAVILYHNGITANNTVRILDISELITDFQDEKGKCTNWTIVKGKDAKKEKQKIRQLQDDDELCLGKYVYWGRVHATKVGPICLDAKYIFIGNKKL